MGFLSATYTNRSINTGLLVLRLGMCILLIPHGYNKLVNFAGMKDKFLSFLGLGSDVSLGLSLFAEFFCGLFVLFGLFTRLATIPIIINMGVATALAHNFDVFDTAEKPMLFLIGFLTLLITGPGRYSIDGMFRK